MSVEAPEQVWTHLEEGKNTDDEELCFASTYLML